MTNKNSLSQQLDDSDPLYDREQSPGDLVILAARLYSRALLTRIALSGVTRGQWPFLVVLCEEDGISQRELSERRGIREATTVRALDRMEKDGLVERVRDPNDRRRIRVYLTPGGRALRNDLVPFALDVNELSLAPLSPEEQTQFMRHLKTVIATLVKDSHEHDQEPPSRI